MVGSQLRLSPSNTFMYQDGQIWYLTASSQSAFIKGQREHTRAVTIANLTVMLGFLSQSLPMAILCLR